jgi:hypothetical protein
MQPVGRHSAGICHRCVQIALHDVIVTTGTRGIGLAHRQRVGWFHCSQPYDPNYREEDCRYEARDTADCVRSSEHYR